jgi:DNA-binding CsgD family transcriptional regulator
MSPEVRSFPTRLDESGRAIVIHVIPLYRAASDIFGTGAALVAVTGYSVEGNLPSDFVLRGLFDLSVAEAGIATDLSAGLSLKEVAVQRGISLNTVRTHLAHIFRKTGTNHQSELVALLKGASGFSRV